MKTAGTSTRTVFSELKLFLALSRTTHGLLDLATPAVSALLWLNRFPSPWIVAVGLLTAFAGYTAVYALNDLVDYKADLERIKQGGPKDEADYLDTVFVRHPLAQGLLSLRKGVTWVLFWAVTALIGASLLSPVCALLFLGGVILEAIYCLMLRVSHLRLFVSGIVKTLGGIAAVFAVDPAPSSFFITLLFLWLFFWEIGGQNVPADWHDMDEDSELRFKTIPVWFGTAGAARIILISLSIAVLLNLLLICAAPGPFPVLLAAGCLVAGVYLLLLPAYHLLKVRTSGAVSALFGKASLYPAAVLIMIVIRLAVRS